MDVFVSDRVNSLTPRDAEDLGMSVQLDYSSTLDEILKQTLPQSAIASVIASLQLSHPKAGQEIWTRGKTNSADTGLYFLLAGQARLLNLSEDLIATLPAGLCWGEQSLFPQEAFLPFRLRASFGSTIGFLPGAVVINLMAQHPEFKTLLYRQSARWDLLLLSEQQSWLEHVPKSHRYACIAEARWQELAVGPLNPRGREPELWYIRRGCLSGGSPARRLERNTLTEIQLADRRQSYQVLQPIEGYCLPKAALEQSFAESELSTSSLSHRFITDRAVVEEALTDNQQRSPLRNSPRKLAGANQSSAQKSETLYFPKPTHRLTQYFQRRTRRYPFLKQQSQMDCGVTCLVMVGLYWGKRLSLNQLRDMANVSRHGTTLRGLIAAAEQTGLNVRPVKGGLEGLIQQKLPAIAHWEGNHYIVVNAINRRHVYVSDPQIGRKRLTHDEFKAGWTGYTLLLEPTLRFNEVAEAKHDLWRYLELLKPHRVVLGEIIAASIVLQIFGVCTPLFTQQLIDQVVERRSEVGLYTIGSGLLIFTLFSLIMKSLRRYLLFHTATRVDMSLALGFISHTFRLPLPYFDSRFVGDIISRIQENRKIRAFLSGEALLTSLDLITVVIYIGVMFWYNWQLALMAITLIPLLSIITLIATPFLKRISRETFTAATKDSSYLIESLTGIGTVKSMGIEQLVRWRWEELMNQTMRIGLKGSIIQERLRFSTGFIESLGTKFLFLFGVWLVIQGQLSLGQLVAFNMLIGNVFSPFERLIGLWNSFQEVLISVERLNDVLGAPVEESLQDHLPAMPNIIGQVEFQNISFRYSPDSTAETLSNISFSIQPGQTIALVGRSGSGKTTLAKLLLGLYPLNGGRILIDGYDIANVSKQSLRTQIGVVDQDTFLFGGTIRENLTVADPSASLDEIQAAAQLAAADVFINELPLNYDSPIGEGGSMLSGGQRQRLAIARALIRNPRLLVLDEATSNLDPESESLIQRNLNTILKDRTTLIIAHRLSTVQNADLILVLDRGVLIESGTHEALMTQRGHYFYLNQQQLAAAG
jgi:HlyB family type I secretion system ABC transporter